MNRKVYLSGPITGLTYEDAVEWTNYAKTMLANFGIDGFRPLRGESYGGIALPVITNQRNRECIIRDRYDVMTSDCILVNLFGANKPSFGTYTEIAWAFLLQKPVVLVMENKGNLHEHGFLQEMVSHRTDDLDEGIDYVKTILLP